VSTGVKSRLAGEEGIIKPNENIMKQMLMTNVNKVKGINKVRCYL
jgi:hypothetical protein